MVAEKAEPFQLERYGVIMEPDLENPREAWGVLNPGGVRGPDGDYYIFPRVVAEGNFSRIGRARVIYDNDGRPIGVERLGYVLEPREPYEVTHAGGGVEDPRVTYLEPLKLYVMTYTAYTPPFHPRIALAVSHDLVEWTRLGPLHYAVEGGLDLNEVGNKDGLVFPEVIHDPQGRPAMAIIHRPSFAVGSLAQGGEVKAPPSGAQSGRMENIWISYAPLDGARADVSLLTHVCEHRLLMEPRADWESVKIGGGAPPLRLPYGWLLLYHGVSGYQTATKKHVRYSAGAAVLDLADPTKVLYRSPRPILEPQTPQEMKGIVPSVVFPTATDPRDAGRLDVYYGGADSVISAAHLTIPGALPTNR